MSVLGDSAADAAVIDVGSNSVRLVVYRVEGRAIWTVFNEKILAGLGREVAETGRLSLKGVETATAALRRFARVIEALAPAAVFTAATAAVREAADGPQFVDRVARETGLRLRVLSGEDEARYAALGVLAGQPNADGVAADMGGSSLELTRISPAGPGQGITLALGPFALGAPKPIDLGKTRSVVTRRLAQARGYEAAVLHAVGGAWRNLALLQMQLSDYPLHIVHQYEMTAAEARDAAGFIARQSRQSLERIPGLSKKRVETLPYSAVVLDEVIEALGVQRVSVSAYGLREGLLLGAMREAVQARDPLLEGVAALATSRGLAPGLGTAIEAWVAPALAALPSAFGDRDQVLTAAASRLADLGARLHPDHRADLVFEQVLRAPIAGLTHPERAFLAMAAFYRHSTEPLTPEPEIPARLLSPEQQRRARALGAAVRLACDLSGRSPALLAQSAIRVTAEGLSLTAKDGLDDVLLGEQTAKRAGVLANLLGLRLAKAA